MLKKGMCWAVVLIASWGLRAEGGVMLGLNASRLSLSKDLPGTEINTRTGLRVGGFYSMALSKHFSLQPEAYFGVKGTDMVEGTLNARYELSYIEVPLLLKYTVNPDEALQLGFLTGPYLAFKTRAVAHYATSGQSMDVDLDELMKGMDFGMVLAANCGFRAGSGAIMLDLRVNLGFSDIGRNLALLGGDLNNNDTVRNSGFAVMVGYAF